MKRLQALLACLVLASAPARAGVVIMLETKQLRASPPEVITSRLSLEGDRMRADLLDPLAAEPAATAIFRADLQKMLSLDHATRTYTEMDKAQIDKMAGELTQAMAEMRAQLAQMPPEQRAMVEGMMSQLGPAAAQGGPGTVRKTIEQQTISGHPCFKYEVVRGGKVVTEVWATEWAHAGVPKESLDVMTRMADFYGALTEAVKSGSPGLAWDAFAEFKQIDGYPVMIKVLGASGVEAITLFKSAEQKPLAASLFEVPAGYTRTDLPGSAAP